jgi:hypothetical protein
VLAGAVELRNTVSSLFGLELPATATFDHPTTDALAHYIASRIALKDAQLSQQTSQPVPSTAAIANKLAVRVLYTKVKHDWTLH